LEGAIDRFAQFFEAPLFSAAAASTESSTQSTQNMPTILIMTLFDFIRYLDANHGVVFSLCAPVTLFALFVCF
jgi:hypothetical protein